MCIVVKSCLTFEFECSSWLYGDELNSGFLALAVGAQMLESTALRCATSRDLCVNKQCLTNETTDSTSLRI